LTAPPAIASWAKARGGMEAPFYIVYIGGTVAYLRPLTWSIARNTSCNLRLVANGCSHGEIALLEEMARREPRIDVSCVSIDRIMHHGQVLTLLQQREKSEYFCFLDSDIFATGNFMAELGPMAARHAAVFTANPIWAALEWQVEPRDSVRMVGSYTRTWDGRVTGSAYFAMYRNDAVSQVVEQTGIGLSAYRWTEIHPTAQAILQDLGLSRERYDTGKVMNIMLRARGHSLTTCDCSAVWHLGGFSVRCKRESQSIEDFAPARVPWDVLHMPVQNERGDTATGAMRSLMRMALVREPAMRYFTEVLRSGVESAERTLPSWYDAVIAGRLRQAAERLVTLRREFDEEFQP